MCPDTSMLHDGIDVCVQVKIAMLNYMHSLVAVMEPADFVNTMDTRLAVSRVINWTMEPRNVDVRKVGDMLYMGMSDSVVVCVCVGLAGHLTDHKLGHRAQRCG